jgi:hypothetical protein
MKYRLIEDPIDQRADLLQREVLLARAIVKKSGLMIEMMDVKMLKAQQNTRFGEGLSEQRREFK